MIRISRAVETAAPLDRVAEFLTDFTTTAEWDPRTASCRRIDQAAPRPVAAGACYENTQRLGPLHPTLHYEVREYAPQRRIVLVSEGALFSSTDVMTFAATPHGTRVTYTAEFRLGAAVRVFDPLVRLLARRIGDDGEAGLRAALDRLAAEPAETPAPRPGPVGT